MQLDSPIGTIPGIGPSIAKKLQKLEVFRIRDLLYYFPWRYDDLRTLTPIDRIAVNTNVVIEAELTHLAVRHLYHRRSSLVEGMIKDSSGTLGVVWFNQPYLASALQVGQHYIFAGKTILRKHLQLQNPVWERASGDMVHVGRVVPIYSLTAGLYPKSLRTILKRLIDALPPELPDSLPLEIMKRFGLGGYKASIVSMHFPKTLEAAAGAKKRFAFEELFDNQLERLILKKQRLCSTAPTIPFDKTLIQKFVASLPFTLTPGQKKCAWEILRDLELPKPSNRMLSGDVGSGKTIVAAIAALQVIKSGWRVLIMAPTEILAAQHFATFRSLPIFQEMSIGLVTGSKREIFTNGKTKSFTRQALLKAYRTSQVPDLLIGTHALIQDPIFAQRAGLIVIDEQHRFGVGQRARLLESQDKALRPHLLSMTATPIPRTLAISLFGDLDVSRLAELPRARKPVTTRIVEESNRSTMENEIKSRLKLGQQVFVVCPLIDPSDSLGVKSATEEYDRLKTESFRENSIGLLHGKLSTKAKDELLTQFAQKKIELLVTTTVVEVGIDFPNATSIIIEGAERFGLAQLHQLRGRIGRGSHPGFCYLVPSEQSAGSQKRLQAVVNHASGFELAEIDLRLRGPGETYGQKQSGYPEFKLADPFDIALLNAAHKAAEMALSEQNIENSPQMIQKLKQINQSTHME